MEQIINFIQQNHQLIILGLSALVLILIFGFTYLFLQIKNIKNKQEVLFQGKEAKDLEKIIEDQHKEIKKNRNDAEDLLKLSEKIHQIASQGIQKIGLVRFNPFGDIGGDQSFAIAFLDAYDNGLIISSLHSKEGTRVYAKPVEKGKSSYQLSDEEKKAVEEAMEK
jgi:cell division protein FtsL